MPFVLRQEGNFHRLVGESYVHDLMEGQAIKESTKFEELLLH